MRALVYTQSVPRYLLSRLFYRFFTRRFWPVLAPLKVQRLFLNPPGPDWVILRNRLCGICGSDLNLLKGAESYLLEPYGSFPAVLGHEVLAEVAEAPSKSGWQPGERVVVEPVLSCEVRGLPPCRYCSRGEYNLCENFTQGILAPGATIGFNQDASGGLAEFMAAHPRRLVRVPADLADEVAVLTDSLASALQPVLDHLPAAGDTVVVFGAGIIGQHLVRLVRILVPGAKVVAVARYAFQEHLAKAGGADIVLMFPSREELAVAVGARLLPTTLGGGNPEGGADIVFDCVGSSGSLQEGLLALRARGTYVLVGTAGTWNQVDFSSLWFRELRVTGSAMYGHGYFQGQKVRTYEIAVELLARGNYPSQGLLTHTFPLADYRQAFQVAFNKPRYECVKVAVDLRE